MCTRPPPDAPQKLRYYWVSWAAKRKKRGLPCGWEDYLSARDNLSQKRREALSRVRCKTGHGNTVTPVGTPVKLRKAFCKFRAEFGRCEYAAWFAWYCNKGPYPLKFL